MRNINALPFKLCILKMRTYEEGENQAKSENFCARTTEKAITNINCCTIRFIGENFVYNNEVISFIY